jgi:DNA-binding winged helix-turn-helix (wHTH) protein
VAVGFGSGRYTFGSHALADDGTLLVRDGVPVAVPPKALHMLLVLVRHAGEVVRKNVLLRAIWPDTFVEESGLARNVCLLRQALGEGAQHVIVTVPRVGYRFAAAVTWSAVPAGRRPPDAPTAVRGDVQPVPLVVGRDVELAVLRQAFDRARRGPGRIVAVAGEPGIGKTTVVETFLRAAGGDALAVRGRCSKRLAGAEPHRALLEILDAVVATEPSYVERLRRIAPTWARHVAARVGDADAGGADGPGSATALMRELTLLLEDISRERPLAIVVDDVHWIDLATIDVLAHLAPCMARIRGLILITYRDHEIAQAGHPFGLLRLELLARRELDEIRLWPLGPDAVREYVAAAIGDESATGDLATLVFERTRGNPLFMADVVRYLRDAGGQDAARQSTLLTPVNESALPAGTMSTRNRFTHVLSEERLAAARTPSRRVG